MHNKFPSCDSNWTKIMVIDEQLSELSLSEGIEDLQDLEIVYNIPVHFEPDSYVMAIPPRGQLALKVVNVQHEPQFFTATLQSVRFEILEETSGKWPRLQYKKRLMPGETITLHLVDKGVTATNWQIKYQINKYFTEGLLELRAGSIDMDMEDARKVLYNYPILAPGYDRRVACVKERMLEMTEETPSYREVKQTVLENAARIAREEKQEADAHKAAVEEGLRKLMLEEEKEKEMERKKKKAEEEERKRRKKCCTLS